MAPVIAVIESSALSEIGPVREDNQDTVFAADLQRSAADLQRPAADPQHPPKAGSLFAIADGMGGYAHGGLASSLALQTLTSELCQTDPPNPKALRRGIETANLGIYKTAQKLEAWRMGTTLTAVYILGGSAHLAHIGDSRAYLVRNRRATCLTDDHTHGEIAEQHASSLHGRALARRDPLAPGCTTCHGMHEILPSKDHRADTSPLRIPYLCGKCHQEGAPVARQRTNHQSNILENYSQSIHGEGLLKRGLTVVAVCIDCHTAHNTLPHTDPKSSINRANVARVCEKCHSQIERVHVKVIRGELWEKAPNEVPACVDCHQPHRVRRVFYDSTYERRRQIIQEHADYQQGWLYFIANDPRVPEDVRTAMSAWGLARDEFADNGHWAHQIYVREARRMVGRFVMTEHELLKKRPTPEPVGMGSYGIDSLNIQRYVTPEGHVQNEGDICVPTGGPYQISYGSLVPKRGQTANLLVPVAVSSSHVAYGSIRMEPVFMILGQSAATAAVMAIDGRLAVQDVPYDMLRARLLEDRQVLDYPGGSRPR